MKNINITTKISKITLLISILQLIAKLAAYLHPEYMYIQQVDLLLEFARTAITIFSFYIQLRLSATHNCKLPHN